MQKTITFLTAVLCLASARLQAQTFSITGQVKDKTGAAIAAATVSLLKASDSSWIKSELTGDNGNYTLQDIHAGNYIIAVTLLGYAEKRELVTVGNENIVAAIILDKQSNVLEEITVTGNKPFIEREAGKTIVNITAEKAAGNTVLDMMRKLPGVTVNGSGAISMAGKQGVLVLINGKQTYLSGEELANYLRSMSAEQLAQVEIMSQPSAKYDAEGNTGIINIKTRKNEKEGISGTASATYSQTAFAGTEENLHINYKKNKTSLMTNAGYYNRAGFLKQRVDRNFRDKQTHEITGTQRQSSYWTERFKDYSLSLDGTQEFNDNTSIDLHVNAVYHPNHETDKAATENYDVASGSVITNDFVNNRDFLRRFFNGIAQLNQKFGKEHELTVNCDYYVYDVNNYQDIVNSNFDANGNPVPGGISLKGYLPTDIKVTSVKADYTGAIGKTKVEGGVKSSFVAFETGVFFDINDNGTWRQDTVRTNNFLYNENIHSAYLSCSHPFGEKLDAKIGLRAEQTNARGFQEFGSTGFERHYLSLFPTAFVSYKLNNDYSFECNYGRRIQRPEYRQMNPYVEFISQYSYKVGNPRLMPQYTHNVELAANYKTILNCKASYSSVSDIINNIARQDNQTFIYYVMPENIAKNTAWQFSVTFNKALFNWWEVSSTAYAFALGYEGIYNEQAFRDWGTGSGLWMSSDFSFLHNWKASYWLHANGTSRETSMVTAQPNLYYGFSFSKKLFHDTTLVKLDVVDPFRTYEYNFGINIQDVDTQISNRYNTREYALSITYDFGKQLDRMRKINNAADETGRMKM